MFIDLHSDLFTSEKSDEQIKMLAKKAKKQKARVIYAVYNDGKKGLDFLAERAAFIKKTTDERCALENVCYICESADNRPIDALFKTISAINPLCASLCWNNENAFACGCACQAEAFRFSSAGGIKKLGKDCVRFFNESKMPLDLSHINERGFYDGVELSFKPLCTHSALYDVFPHRRNLKNEQIKALLKKGGIFGLIGVKHFLCEKNQNAEAAFFIHVNEYLQNFGTQGLCIGSDFFGSDAPLIDDGDYGAFLRLLGGLKKLGLKKEDISRVLYKNAAEFFGFAENGQKL